MEDEDNYLRFLIAEADRSRKAVFSKKAWLAANPNGDLKAAIAAAVAAGRKVIN